jgi:hypothetical protein
MFWRIIITIVNAVFLVSCIMYHSDSDDTIARIAGVIISFIFIILSILAIIGAWVI